MADELAWDFPVVVDELPEEGAEFELAPDEEARTSLASHAGVIAVPELTAVLNVRPDGRGGALVEGSIEAVVTQTCVVSLEDFDNRISESVSIRFSPDGVPQPESEVVFGMDDEEPPDALIDGTIDLAAVVAEFLTLAVDPYPRRPGAVFTPPQGDTDTKSSTPFAALEGLKGESGKKG